MLNLKVLDKFKALPLDTQEKIVKRSRCNEDYDFDLNPKDQEDIQKFLHQLNLIHKNKNSETFFKLLNFIKFPIGLQDIYKADFILNVYYLPIDYKWRIDISVPKANAILVNINKQNEESIYFRLDVTTFHKLRFNITLMLDEIRKLKRSVDRIKRV